MKRQDAGLLLAILIALAALLVALQRPPPKTLSATGGTGVGPAQDATGQAINLKLGATPIPCGGTGVGALQDATMQCVLTAIGGSSNAILANHAIADAAGTVNLNSSTYVPLAKVASFTLTASGTGKVRVIADAVFEYGNEGGATATLGVSVVAAGAIAPTTADYGTSPVTLVQTGNYAAALVVDYGGGASFPSALTPGSSYDIYAVGLAAVGSGVSVVKHGVQIAVQEQP